VAEEDAVQEGRQRLGVEGARPTGDHERMPGAARGGAQRDAAQLEHGEEIRVGELVLEAEAEHVEVGEREVALERDQREPARAQQGLDRKSTRLNSSHDQISYAVFCLKKKKKTENTNSD